MFYHFRKNAGPRKGVGYMEHFDAIVKVVVFINALFVLRGNIQQLQDKRKSTDNVRQD